MEKICLDGGVTVDFLKGENNIVEKLKYYADEEICITSFTLFELLCSIKKIDVIKHFVNNITVLSFNENCGIIASRIYDGLREKGIPSNTKSVITAATCIDSGAFLFTNNRKDYEQIRGLKLV